MKVFRLVLSLGIVAMLFAQCQKDEMDEAVTGETLKKGSMAKKFTFNVTIENVSDFWYFESGVFNTPDGADKPGPLLPGHSYSFSFHAAEGHKLSFATMFVKSNDLFYGPSDMGLDLFDGGGNPLTGDITNMIYLWDAGTEVNDQPMYQPPNPGGTDENGNVVVENNDVSDVISVSLTYNGEMKKFTLTIENVSDSYPLAPGVFAVHMPNDWDPNSPYPLYENGVGDYGYGLEALAEDGDPSMLWHHLKMNTGVNTPVSPGVWVVHRNEKHRNNNPLFDVGEPASGALEKLAEDGMPDVLKNWLTGEDYYADDFGATPPGGSTSFEIEARGGDYLSFATMFVKSNDLFFSPGETGIQLFSDTTIEEDGEVTYYIKLWDAGTEVNEYPGVGEFQPLIGGPDTGEDEEGVVMMVDDHYTYPKVNETIKVTITRN